MLIFSCCCSITYLPLIELKNNKKMIIKSIFELFIKRQFFLFFFFFFFFFFLSLIWKNISFVWKYFWGVFAKKDDWNLYFYLFLWNEVFLFFANWYFLMHYHYFNYKYILKKYNSWSSSQYKTFKNTFLQQKKL